MRFLSPLVSRASCFLVATGAAASLLAANNEPVKDLVLNNKTYANPIIPGFNPDPSICRVGKDFYLVTSSFEYFPGVPVYHSTDLVHWQMIGHALQRPSQLDLDGYEASAGIFAPTIRYDKGMFYMVTTLVSKGGGDFIVTAQNPAGPWSEPHWIKAAPGIDPSLFFDDDGKVYMSGNERAKDRVWEGQNNIWIQELDVKEWKLVGERRNLVVGADYYHKGSPIEAGNVNYLAAIEGAHLYKKGGVYYVAFSHGGTGQNHAVSVLKSKSIFGPYEENPANPILTHRDLSRTFPITTTGHADLVDTPNGDWWIVYLGKRPYEGEKFILGRETFLSPVDWSGDWPVVNPGRKVSRSELVQLKPALKASQADTARFHDDFNAPNLHPQWTFIRTPRSTWWSLTDRKGYLRIQLRPETIAEKVNPSFIGMRMEDMQFSASAKMEFAPDADNEEAGIMVERDRNYYLKFTLSVQNGKPVLKVMLKNGPATNEVLLASAEVNSTKLKLKISAHGLVYGFSYSINGRDWVTVKDQVDCSSNGFVAGGKWTGSFVGMYVSANGQPGKNHADFDWFDYQKAKRN